MSQLADRSLHLREVIESDLPVFYKQQREPEANAMAAFPAREWDAFMAHWVKIMADESVILRTIVFGDEVVGNILSFQVDGKPQVGYWLGKDYWGKGIATNSLQAFLQIVKVRPLYAHVVEHNIGSIRVLEKCGFELCGETAGFTDANGMQLVELVMRLG